ncbi:DNA modification methylase [Microbacterium sp. NPDC003461]
MNSRTLASLALGGLVVLGTAGCAAITPQATTIDYSPSDGVNVPLPEDSPIEILNALVVTDEDGRDGGFVATIVNTSDARATVSLDWGGGAGELTVPAESSVSLGVDEDPLLLENIDTPAGATMPIVFNAGGEPVEAQVQVFDETLEYLEGLAPSE